MSDNMPNPTDWVYIYQDNLPTPQNSPPSTTIFSSNIRVPDATAFTTTPTLASTSPPHHGPLGHDSRPVRRRSRASRRTPTTAFNTDTRNFRAMVQLFTGNQTAPFDQLQRSDQFFRPNNINLHQQTVNPNAYNIQQEVHQNQQKVQQNLPYANPPPQGQIGETLYFHGLGNNSSSTSNMEVSENLAMDGRINPLPYQHQRGRN